MFHFLEYPFSRGSTFITSPSAYDAPDFDAGFMNDKRDMAPMGKRTFPIFDALALLIRGSMGLHQVS
jgi:hypothetical protein